MAALLKQALERLITQGELSSDITPEIVVERTRDQRHGDFATNLALMLAKPAKLNPRQLAEKIVRALPEDQTVAKIEIAGPGFINFFIDPDSQYQVIKQIHEQSHLYGRSNIGSGKKFIQCR